MYEVYCLKIEIEHPGQLKLIDLILDCEHNVEEPRTWVYMMEYDDTFGDFPLYYITNFMNILEDKYDDLEKLGIKRNMISIWRCLADVRQVFMDFSSNVLQQVAAEGISLRILCSTLEDDDDDDDEQQLFSYPGKHGLPDC